ncbi:MAG: DNRLRE domain-containing protein, partial [Candidatus Hadarchaeales archaeon]
MVVDLSASSPTAYASGESSSRLDVSTARFIANIEEMEDNRNPFGWWRGVGTYVKEAEPNFTITGPGYDNNILVVSTTEGRRIWTYLRFNLSNDSDFFDNFTVIEKAILMIYITSTSAATDDPMQVAMPNKIQIWAVDNDDWLENITWNNRPGDGDFPGPTVTLSGGTGWTEVDVTQLVKREWKLPLTREVLITLLLREPTDGRENETTTLSNAISFVSKDDGTGDERGFDPRLLVVYSKGESAGKYKQSISGGIATSFINFGYIKCRTSNRYYPDTNFVYEGGNVFRESGIGWYQTLLAGSPDFIVVREAGGNNVYVEVTRYQIKEGKIKGESVAGTGETMVRAQRWQEEWVVEPPSAPNVSEVTLWIISDHISAWRDYLMRLAGEINYFLSNYTSYSSYGPYAFLNYGGRDITGITIKGKDIGTTPFEGGYGSPGNPDIYYSERIIWLDTSTGYYQGGRT